jgi:aminoglycoside N3'-acetyltransferase
MHRLGGKVLLISTDWEICTFFHYVEEQFEVPYRYYKDLPGTVHTSEGPRQEPWQEYAGDLGHGVEDSFNAFGRRVESAGLSDAAWAGPVRLIGFRMDKLFEFTYGALEKDPECLIST